MDVIQTCRIATLTLVLLTCTARAEEPARFDFFGDSLPPGALARLGTTRFRHGNWVHSVALDAEGKQYLTADLSSIRLWERATGKEAGRIGGDFKDRLRQAWLSPNGKTAVSLDDDGNVRVWDVASGKEVHAIACGPVKAFACSFDGRTLATTHGKLIRLWDVAGDKKPLSLVGHEDRVHSVLFAPDGRTVFSSGHDNVIRVWDVTTGKEVRRIEGRDKPVTEIVLSQDGKLLASVGAAKPSDGPVDNKHEPERPRRSTVYLWDAATGKEVRRLEAAGEAQPGNSRRVIDFAFSGDGRSLVTTFWKRGFSIWDVETGKERRHWPHPDAYLLAFSPDGRTFGMVGDIISFWDVEKGEQPLPIGGHETYLLAVASSPDGRTLATGGGDGTIRLWESATGRELRRLTWVGTTIQSLVFTPDGRRLISVANGRTVRAWDVSAGEDIYRRDYRVLVGRPALSHDGQTLAFGLGQKEVVLLNAKTGEEVRRLEGSRQGIDRCFFSPDDQAVLGWGNDKRLHVWEARSGKKHRDFEVGRASDHRPSAFSPDGRLLALRGEPNRLFLCETTDGKLACQLEEMAQSYSPIAFSPDGRTMAVAEFSDRKIALFELATGKVRCIFSGHRSVIRDLAFSPEGKTLASCSQDTTGIVWDVASSLGTRLSPEEVEKRWTELGSDDAARAFQAMKTLIATPELVVPLLAKELRPAAESDSDRLGRIAGWISDLDHDDFARREAASRELAKEIEDAEPLLRKALDTRPSAEVRTRAQALLKGWEEKKELKRVRAARALEVLEHINNAESRRLLAVMAKGTPDARLTREAKASLERLAAQAER